MVRPVCNTVIAGSNPAVTFTLAFIAKVFLLLLFGGNKILTTREEVLKFGLSFKNTYIDTPFHDNNWQLVRIKESKKAFLWTYIRDGYVNINVKVDPEWRDLWRNTYDSVLPAYHQNKEHWNTIILDGSIPDKDIKRMIAESYDLLTDNFAIKVYSIVKSIPRGKVATYGQIACKLGNNNLSRAVGNALHKNKNFDEIPCFRVVNSKGELAKNFAFGGALGQRKLLEKDGVKCIGEENDSKIRVDLNIYGLSEL